MVDTESRIVAASLDQVLRLSSYRCSAKSIGIYHHEWGTATIRDALDNLRVYAPRRFSLVESHTSLISRSGDDRDRANPKKMITYISDRTIHDGLVQCMLSIVHEASHTELFKAGGMIPDDGFADVCIDEEDYCLSQEGNCLVELGRECWEMLGIGYMYPNVESYLGLRRLNRQIERQEL
jgi:hypothetical protein